MPPEANIPEPTNDLDTLRSWIGRSESITDVIAPGWARLMDQTLDRGASVEEGDELPPLWHWIYFLSSVPISGLGPDGHPARGGFLPPVALPRRMWAGGRVKFHGPLHIGETATKTSTITDVVLKTGSSGKLCFVTVTHEISVDGTTAITEEQDLVYREERSGQSPSPPKSAPAEADWSRTIRPNRAMLFRYSALTFNSHRIHYDLDYGRDVEGYPGLVVHGPLTATLLADLAVASAGQPLKSFAFRAMSPLFDPDPFDICGYGSGGTATVWASTPEGGLAMKAEAEFGEASVAS